MPLDSALLATALISATQTAPEATAIEAQSSAPTVALDLPVTLDGVFLGEIVAQVSGDQVAVRPDDILSLLDETIDEATIDAVRAVPANELGFVRLEALGGAGLTIVFDPQSLSLIASLTASQRSVREIGIRNPITVDPDSGITPADFAVGVTAISRLSHIHTQPGGPAEFEPFRSELFGFVNLGGFDGWTLDFGADIETGRDRVLRRRDVALVKDNFRNATRLTIGDLRTRPLSNFQRSVDLVGVSFRRAYEDIQPFLTILPRGQQSFTLERRARVLVEVDGLVAFDEQLPAGSYALSDFPFTTGANSARIIVDDGAGPREVAFLSAFIDTDLLGEGLSRFDLNIGFLSNGFAAETRYSDDLALSVSYDIGVSTDLTLGGHLEASFDLARVSARAAIGTPLGLISGEVSASRSLLGWGAAGVLQYRNQFETGSLRHSVAIQAAWRNSKLQGLAGPEIGETSFDLRWLIQTDPVQLNFDASARKTGERRSSNFGLGATWRLLNANWSARGQFVRASGRDDEYRAFLSVSVPLGRRTRARARLGTDGDARLDLQRFGGFSVGESQTRAQFIRTPDGLLSGSAQFDYISNRAELALDHQTRETPNGIFSRSEITAAMGIGFADGALQVGRPFDAGFVIVKRHETIRDNRTSIDEGGLGVASRSDVFGPPLIPLRAGYSNYAFSVEVDELEPGYDLGIDRIETFPPFRAGYRVDIGSEILATVLLRLQMADGEPVGLSTGRIFNSEDGSEVGRFFTNRTGRLVFENLAPGTYEIKLDGRSNLVATLTVEEGETGIVQRGALTMETSQ